jgi:hypothetical protein
MAKKKPIIAKLVPGGDILSSQTQVGPDPRPDAGVAGRTIVEARPMNAAELKFEGWKVDRTHASPTVLVLDDGTKLYPSRDEEGNGPGALFGTDAKGGGIAVF